MINFTTKNGKFVINVINKGLDLSIYNRDNKFTLVNQYAEQGKVLRVTDDLLVPVFYIPLKEFADH